VALDREPDFQKIESRSRGVQLVALVGLTLAGGVIVSTWGFAIGWLAEAAVCAIGLAIACAMMEPPACTSETLSGDVSPRRSIHISPAERGMFLKLIGPASLLGAAAGAAAFVAQTSGGADPGPITILVAIITLAEAAGSAIAGQLAASMKSQMILAGFGAAVATAGLALPAAFVPMVVALSFLMGIAQPLRAAAIQRATADHVRARAASVASACDKAAATVALVLAGSLRRRRR
jgi:hypothetical protein